METLGFIWCCTPAGLGSTLVAVLFVLLVFPETRALMHRFFVKSGCLGMCFIVSVAGVGSTILFGGDAPWLFVLLLSSVILLVVFFAALPPKKPDGE